MNLPTLSPRRAADASTVPNRMRRPRAHWLLAALFVASAASPGAHAQAPSSSAAPAGRESSQGVRDPRLSDTDRVFMRGVAGLVIRNRQLGELGRKKLRSGPARNLASALSSESDALFTSLRSLSEDLRTPIPLDMSDVADRRLQALGKDRGQAFVRNFQALAAEWLQDEIKSLEDSINRSENERVRQWARTTLDQRRKLLAQAQGLSSTRAP